MPILIAGMKETNEQIKDMPMTLGQAGVALRNNFQFIVGDVQKATNGFSHFAAVVNKSCTKLRRYINSSFGCYAFSCK